MKKLALTLIGIIIVLTSQGQSLYEVTSEYSINGIDTVEVDKTIDQMIVSFKKGKVILKLENFSTSSKEKITMIIMSCESEGNLSHVARFSIYNEKYGEMLLVTNEGRFGDYKLYGGIDDDGEFHRLVISRQ